MKVLIQQLVDILSTTEAKEISVVYKSEAKLSKTNNPFYHKEGRSWVPDHTITKVTNGTYDFGGPSYKDRVNDALQSEGKEANFETEGLRWGTWKVPGKVLENAGKFYITAYAQKDNPAKVTYMVDGKDASDDELKIINEFLPGKSGSAKQASAGLEVGKQIVPINFDLSKLESITIDGVEYTV